MSKKTKKFIIAAAILVGVLIVISVIVVVTLDTTDKETLTKGEPISMDEFLNGTFRTKSFNGTWSKDSKIIWTTEDGSLVKWDVETGETSVVVAKETMSKVSKTATFISFSPNNTDLLLFYDNREPIWRWSFYATYIVLNAKNNETYQIEPKGSAKGTKLRHAEWRSDSNLNEILYNFNNNIYLLKDVEDPESAVQLTDDGEVDAIYNGIPDWVYEEEVLGTNTAMHISDNGQFMLYAQFNDTKVDSFYYTIYGDPKNPKAHRYTQNIKLPYPKVGTANPTIKLFVVDLNDQAQLAKEVIPPQSFFDNHGDDYIYWRAYWIADSKIGIIWMNRVQNSSSTSECIASGTTWSCESVFDFEQKSGWLMLQQPYYKSADSGFLQLLPQKNANSLEYQHLALVKDKKTQFLNINDQMVVTQILTWSSSRIYFVGTKPNEPGMRHLYVTDETVPGTTCMTCNLTMSGDGVTSVCENSDFYLSPDIRHYVQVCKGPDVGEVVVRSIRGQIVQVIADNKELRESLSKRALPQVKRLMVDVGENFVAPVIMQLPASYDASASKKYPLIISVYGGPESQEVDHSWSVGWQDFLVTNYDVVYASIDGRGTGFQSNDYIYSVFHKLGSFEMVDQIEVTKTLLETFQYLDSSRVGIWGWSYGGYATLKTLSMDTDDVFKCGISVAPPTDWLFYDTVYTERFMGLPTADDNEWGYNTSSLLNKVESLRGKDFMINHGVADDNVHYQQSMMLIKALEREDVTFIQNSYPDENHGLGNVKKFLYHNFDTYWTNCFGLQSVIKT